MFFGVGKLLQPQQEVSLCQRNHSEPGEVTTEYFLTVFSHIFGPCQSWSPWVDGLTPNPHGSHRRTCKDQNPSKHEDFLLLLAVFGYTGTSFSFLPSRKDLNCSSSCGESDHRGLLIPRLRFCLRFFSFLLQLTGVPLNVSIRLQLNLYMKRVSGIT